MKKTLIIGLVVAIIFLILSFVSPVKTQVVRPWKFAVAGNTQSGHDAHAKVLAALKTKMPNSSRITYLNLGNFTISGGDPIQTNKWDTWKKIVIGTYDGSIPSGILPSNWWTSYHTSPPEYFSPPGRYDDLGHPSGHLNWTNFLPAQVGLSAYSGIPGDSHGVYGSVKYDNVLWIWLSSGYTPYGSSNFDSDQISFLKNTLVQASRDASVYWRFVMLHDSIFNCGTGGEWLTGKTWYDQYFKDYVVINGVNIGDRGVDIILTGYGQFYTRNCPVASSSNRICESGYSHTNSITGNPIGPIHFISGGGGATLYYPGYPGDAGCELVEQAARSHHFLEVSVISNQLLTINMWEVDSNLSYPYLKSSIPFDTLTFNKPSTPLPTGGPTSTPTRTPTPTPPTSVTARDLLANYNTTSSFLNQIFTNLINLLDLAKLLNMI